MRQPKIHYIFNKEMECMAPEERRKLQGERLRQTIELEYNNVPAYRERMDAAGVKPEDINSIDDIVKLPFMQKTDLRDNFPFGLFAADKKDIIRIQGSSGTTGKPIVSGYTQNDIDVWTEMVARAMKCAGADENDIIQVAYGYGLFTGGLGAHQGATEVGAMVVPMSSGNTQRQIMMLKELGATMLCCTPSYATYLAETIREMGIDPSELKIKSGCFGAEPWTEEMRHNIEETLGIKAYDIYGLTEISGPGVSFECEEQAGMHIQEDHFIPEIINPDTGEVLPEGEVGELVFTCITKKAFPLLRYRTRDLCYLTRKKCSCGRTHIRMHKPTGRSDDMMVVKGVNVWPSQIEAVLLKQGFQANYQIVVDRLGNNDTIEVQVELTPEMVAANDKTVAQREKEIVAGLKSMLGIKVDVKVVDPKTIVRSEGKAVRVVDKRNLYQ